MVTNTNESFPRIHKKLKQYVEYIEFVQSPSGYGHKLDSCSVKIKGCGIVVFHNAEVIYAIVREWTVAEFPNSNVTRYYP